MGSDILSIGKSGLFAAQVGITTTGHNIANANVDGYNRQAVVQTASTALDFGYGFVGTGTTVQDVKRYYDDFLTTQVRSAQSSVSALDAFNAQISQVDNLLADQTSGLSPSLQGFFKGVQDLASSPDSEASRQALLSNADTLAASFQSMNGRLQDIRDGVNNQITSNVTLINSYATQIAQLNDQISSFSSDNNKPPNDLMDQRDQLVLNLNKQIKATVVQGDNNTVTVSIGSGLPLVVGKDSFQLQAVQASNDVSRVEVGYVTGPKVTVLGESSLTGGELGGLMEFRSQTLDPTQNSLGRIALGLATTFNAQHALGQDETGATGGAFFNQAPVEVAADVNNSTGGTTKVTATISDVTKLTTSDYNLHYDGSHFIVTRASDGAKFPIVPYPQSTPQVIDGVAYAITGSAATNDNFAIHPTRNGASDFNVLITDRAKIAAAAPITTAVPITNKGDAQISAGSVDQTYLAAGNALTTPVTLSYDLASNTLNGFPVNQGVTVTTNGVATQYAAGDPVVYAPNSTYSFGGINVDFTGTPADTDTFSVAPNANGVGDSRNALLLGQLQTANIFDGATATFQGAYAQTVSFVGNKAREVQVNDTSAQSLLDQATTAQQSVSGVNLDEEATNLLRYQQAYQASGKVMQIASQLFDTLLSIGH